MEIRWGVLAVAVTSIGCIAGTGARAAVVCEDLLKQPWGGATVTAATMVPAAAGIPAFCKVMATAGKNTDTQKELDIEVWLPEGWRGRLLHIGGSGFDGVLPLDQGPSSFFYRYSVEKPLQQGFALACSNGGHRGGDYPGATFGLDFTMAQDYAHVAIATTVRVAKALVAAHYGEPPTYSYFWGCSNGGRGAFNAAAKYPGEYDGVVAVSPTRNMAGQAAAWMEFGPASILTPGKIATVKSAAVAACDGLDGLRDGVISNPDACRFDPASLLCGGAVSDACLTSAEVAIVRKIQSDLKLADGRQIYSRMGFGELNASQGYSGFGSGYVKDIVFRDPDYAGWGLDKDYPSVEQVLVGAYGFNGETKALAEFLQSGKKMIVVHGTDDTLISHWETARGFHQFVSAAGPYYGRKNARLYMAAGMGHCSGGSGADSFDAISPLAEWVERGRMPSGLQAAKRKADGSVVFTRPLCEFPAYPRYRGWGDVDAARSFACVGNAAASTGAVSDATPASTASSAAPSAGNGERRIPALRPGPVLTVYLDQEGVAWDRAPGSPGAVPVSDEELSSAPTVLTVVRLESGGVSPGM